MAFKTLDKIIDVYSLHRDYQNYFPFLLESVAKNQKIGRYDILFYRSQQKIVLKNIDDYNFLDCFDLKWKVHQVDEDKEIPDYIPFRGGWFIFLSYELAQQIEPSLSLTASPCPIAYAAKCGAAIIVDNEQQKTYLVSDLSEPDGIYDMQILINSYEQEHKYKHKHLYTNIYEDCENDFINGVDRSKKYIVNGDVFQVNLSRRWSFDLPKDSINLLYNNLRISNPAPFAASCHLDYDSDVFSILSSSPERLVSVKNKKIETRPIAGTRPRGVDKYSDNYLASELKEHFKERAEHIMLIDLERNDIGRICKAGTVKVDELMVIESYAHVHHIVSNVIGNIGNDISPADVIRAVFPGGTITGCPKVRCMEIICELEDTYRGAYTGSLGYINHNGDMDSNILIRTFSCYNGRAEFRAGAGIVYDSVAKNELQETRNKAKGLLKAL